MGLPCMRKFGAKWIEQMVEYISANPQFIVRGFAQSGISLALDGISIEEHPEEDTSDNDYEEEMMQKLVTKKRLAMKKNW